MSKNWKVFITRHKIKCSFFVYNQMIPWVNTWDKKLHHLSNEHQILKGFIFNQKHLGHQVDHQKSFYDPKTNLFCQKNKIQNEEGFISPPNGFTIKSFGQNWLKQKRFCENFFSVTKIAFRVIKTFLMINLMPKMLVVENKAF